MGDEIVIEETEIPTCARCDTPFGKYPHDYAHETEDGGICTDCYVDYASSMYDMLKEQNMYGGNNEKISR
jgi:hypothetical protein